MTNTRTLVVGIAEYGSAWTHRTLPGGSSNPLVRAGVLKPVDIVYTHDCDEGCEGCDGASMVVSVNSGPDEVSYCWCCPQTGELSNLSFDEVTVWGYNPQRMADLVKGALCCEVVEERVPGNLWYLGASSCEETQNRPIVVMTELNGQTAKQLKEKVKGGAWLVIAAHVTHAFGDRQIDRRVFSFENVIRFDEDGSLKLVFSEFKNQLSVPLVSRKKRREPVEREKAIAEFLKKRAFAMLGLTYDDCVASRRELKGYKIAASLGMPSSKVTEILSLKGKNPKCAKIPQFYFEVCSKAECFEAFSEVVKSRRRALENETAENLYAFLIQHGVRTREMTKEGVP